MKNSLGLHERDHKKLKGLSTPIKIQDFLDRMPVNYEKKGETIMSPVRALKAGKCHCLEGALIAALALWLNGEEPLLLDLGGSQHLGDPDHVIALYKRNGLWGAISKTNHATIRFRDPVYKTFRELALSYFHEWFMDTSGLKTMRTFSTKALNLKNFGIKWVNDDKDLHYISDALDALPHEEVVPKENRKYLRKADRMEMKAGTILEWKKSDRRT